MMFESGTFFTGCNYWASHAGTNMWSDWRADVVEEDFKKLAAAEVRVLRIFPLWSDFQPLKMHYGGGAVEKEIRFKEQPLDHTPEGKAGVDPVMIARFQEFCDLAAKYDLKLIVGLVTGWMSGRMHMPEAFYGKEMLTDPLVIRWQIRFVRYMVRRFHDHPAIHAWDLGNECNCMGNATHDDAYLWAHAITSAIKLEDPVKPVVSGMHGLLPTGVWSPEDQGEILDILCTHPYPIFTPHCDTDPIYEMKTILHSTAESVMYRSLGGKPCFVEEAGTLGPMIADEDVAAEYIRSALFSTWAHDLHGFVWWCANEQAELTHTPYDWCAVERELGLFHLDGSPKPVVQTMTRFHENLKKLPFANLPKRIVDGICILTKGQDTWAAAYGTFILAKQAGLDIEYAWCQDEIPSAANYFMPSLTGNEAIDGHVLNEILRRVREEGANLYLSINDALMSPFSEYTGVKVKTRSRRIQADSVELDGTLHTLESPIKYVFEAIGAEVLASDADDTPVFTRNVYGKGQVYFLAYPIELTMACEPGLASGPHAVPYYQFYRNLNFITPAKAARLDSPYIGLTEHVVDESTRILTVLNYTPREQKAMIQMDGWKVDTVHHYDGGSLSDGTVSLPGNTGMVLVVKR